MDGKGNTLMVVGDLQAFELNGAELDKAKTSWPALEAQALA